MTILPIEPVIPDLRRALAAPGAAVLLAPPGAGKTTRVPLALLDEPWRAGRRIVMLEPRRLAARAAARRMAETLGGPVGGTVGYRVRLDSRVGPETRIEVVTDGVFIRQLQEDPTLDGVAAVLFDEFHERRLDGDLALALCLEARAARGGDLRLLAMSATLEGEPVARLLGGAPVIATSGRAFPVETRYLARPSAGRPDRRIEDAAAAAVQRALAEEDGGLLVFLPGGAEIRRVAALLAEAGLGPEVAPDIVIVPLYGDLPLEQQDLAIRPAAPGRRKVVLATSIAETSLTIEDVRVVIDAGLARVPRFDPAGGMTRLETVRVSQAAADQRRGRAGRVAPGVCYRLWTEAAHRTLPPQHRPEILEADLAPLALELAEWGVDEPGRLAWLDPPPAAAYAQARELLTRLEALDEAGRITPAGRRMAALGMHPRLAHMVLRGCALGFGGLACELAALLAERDIVKAAPGSRDADLRLRVDLLRRPEEKRQLPPGLTVDRGALNRARQTARQWQRQLLISPEAGDPNRTGLLLAFAYPDRIAQRRPGSTGQFRLSNGRGAVIPATEPLAAEDWLGVADLDGDRREARIFLAAPLALDDLETQFAAAIRTVESVAWDAREEAVLARRQRRLDALVLKDEALPDPPADRVAAALIEGIREGGLDLLPWTPELRAWQARVLFLCRIEGPEAWPDVSDAVLLAGLEDWLAPYLGGLSRRAHLKRLDLGAALRGVLSWQQRQALDAAAPTHLTVPSGSRLPIRYEGETPVLAVRLQEMFGARETPAVAGGKVPLLLHLLSPAQRPVQVTRDLAGFWANTYREVKRDLQGQYPKHFWPDDPLEAEPTRRAKPRTR